MICIKLVSRFAFIVAIATIFGCGGGDGLPRQAISGKVTLDGQPLESATITFQPAGAGETTSAAAQVSGGSFSVPRADGLVPGKYRVSISAVKEVLKKGTGKKTQDSVTGEIIQDVDRNVMQESLPDRFNARTELTADVTDAGPNEFTFAVTSK